jgi:hypothetical protein
MGEITTEADDNGKMEDTRVTMLKSAEKRPRCILLSPRAKDF